MMTYTIRADPTAADAVYQPHGGCKQFVYSHDREVILAGPAQTGKTLAACWILHLTACQWPAAQLAIVRKTQRDMYGSVLQTFAHVIAGAPVSVYGGERPEAYTYANGSKVWIGGMDNADKILSSERDVIYVNQAEQLTLNDWESLSTRTTGRGAVIPYPRLIGDANPGGRSHWILARAAAGRLTLLHSLHTDNPTLYDDGGALTPLGVRTFATLDSLTGVRYQRLRLGQWATAEGAVYDTFDRAVHVQKCKRDEMQHGYMAMDEGYTNPAVVLDVGEDSDGRWHVFREFYRRGVLQSDVVAQAAQWHAEHPAMLIAVDAAAAGLTAEMRNVGLPAVAAKGRVLDGIRAVQDRLKVAGDGRPRLTVDPDCINLINEFESYAWKPERDEPVKENDHALDSIRYLVDATAGSETTTVPNPFYQ